VKTRLSGSPHMTVRLTDYTVFSLTTNFI